MNIGGTDVIFAAPRASFNTRRILEVVQGEWPAAVLEDADTEGTLPVRDLLAGELSRDSCEFFLYRDEASAKSWDEDGLTTANANAMIHVLTRDIPGSPEKLEVTFVVDRRKGKMAALIRRLCEVLEARELID